MRSIATGLTLPRPGRYGLSSAKIASSVTETTAVAEPTSIAWERFISAGSAKNSMKQKMIAAARSRTIQSVTGMTPAAP